MKKYREKGRKTQHIMDLRTTDKRVAEFNIRRPFLQRQNIQEMLRLLTMSGSDGKEKITFIIRS
jgi:hypothetical protein